MCSTEWLLRKEIFWIAILSSKVILLLIISRDFTTHGDDCCCSNFCFFFSIAFKLLDVTFIGTSHYHSSGTTEKLQYNNFNHLLRQTGDYDDVQSKDVFCADYAMNEVLKEKCVYQQRKLVIYDQCSCIFITSWTCFPVTLPATGQMRFKWWYWLSNLSEAHLKYMVKIRRAGVNWFKSHNCELLQLQRLKEKL